jgi:hypothetical protein
MAHPCDPVSHDMPIQTKIGRAGRLHPAQRIDAVPVGSVVAGNQPSQDDCVDQAPFVRTRE